MVAVVSEWTRRDVIDHFDLPAEKVRVVPLAPPLAATRKPTPAERAAVRARFDIPDRYVIYPAQTWPHKNYERLLEALAQLRRDRGLTIPLVATGRQTEHFEVLARAAATLGIADQVRWTGFIAPEELQALVEDATGVIIPTLFEAASAPLWEAWVAGVPAACSNVTSLPDEAGDAAIVFDPLDVRAIAAAISALWQDDELRTRLVERGRARVAGLSWERTARIFRAHYRRLGGRALSDEDVALTR
jgi:glycosyltransferase involved in cell wall biosynthesis